MEEWVHEDETLEDLQLSNLKLLQKKNGFRFGMDAVLLADFARISERAVVGDFGTGTGILPLLLYGRGKGREYHAFEIQPQMAEMARRTMAMNGIASLVHVYQADVAEASSCLPDQSLDAIVCNPPYGMPGRVLLNPAEEKSLARHQTDEQTLPSFLHSAFRMLKGKGRISLVYPAPQLFFLMQQCKLCHLEPKRFRLVYPRADRSANLVLLDAVKDARPLLEPMPPLVVYETDGSLTKELKIMYHIEEQTEV